MEQSLVPERFIPGTCSGVRRDLPLRCPIALHAPRVAGLRKSRIRGQETLLQPSLEYDETDIPCNRKVRAQLVAVMLTVMVSNFEPENVIVYEWPAAMESRTSFVHVPFWLSAVRTLWPGVIE